MCIPMIFQRSSLTYCIPLVKDQSSFYELRNLTIFINNQTFNRVNRKGLKTFLEYLKSYCSLLKMIQPQKQFDNLRQEGQSLINGCLKNDIAFLIFSYLGFLLQAFTIHRTVRGEGDAISLTPLYHLHQLARHLDNAG